MNRLMWALALLLGLTAGSWAAQAPPVVWEGGKEPLQVDADTLEVRGEDALVVFEGNVRARQGDLELEADRVEVTLEPGTRAIREVRARGNVRIRRGEVLATGERAAYDAARGVVVLEGNPKVWRGRDVVAGQRITLYLAENRSVVEGARAVLYPEPDREQGSP